LISRHFHYASDIFAIFPLSMFSRVSRYCCGAAAPLCCIFDFRFQAALTYFAAAADEPLFASRFLLPPLIAAAPLQPDSDAAAAAATPPPMPPPFHIISRISRRLRFSLPAIIFDCCRHAFFRRQ